MNAKLNDLYQRYLEETCTKEERAELFSIIAANPEDPQIEGLLDGTWNKINETEVQPLNNANGMLANILAQHKKTATKKIGWYRYAAVASVVLAISMAIYFYTSRSPVTNRNAETVHDITAGTNRATLTLADGKVINLDSATEGEIAKQAGIVITKTADGQLVYQITAKEKTEAEAYNTITTPRGGQYQVNLPDGTKIWLNAASSLKYPAAFNGKQRRVELLGEAYFEVAKDKTHPFIVATDKQEVQVLGTHFNVNSYADEGVTKTTLLEGSVRVGFLSPPGVEKAAGQKREEKILNPGQQSALHGNSLNVYTVDTEEAIAWKNGYFQFNEADLGSIMRPLARWYNIEVSFEGKPAADLFHFKIPRNLSLKEVLNILEINGINFKIEGRTLIVKS